MLSSWALLRALRAERRTAWALYGGLALLYALLRALHAGVAGDVPPGPAGRLQARTCAARLLGSSGPRRAAGPGHRRGGVAAVVAHVPPAARPGRRGMVAGTAHGGAGARPLVRDALAARRQAGRGCSAELARPADRDRRRADAGGPARPAAVAPAPGGLVRRPGGDCPLRERSGSMVLPLLRGVWVQSSRMSFRAPSSPRPPLRSREPAGARSARSTRD